MRWINLVTSLLLPLACTRTNPGFGEGGGSGTGDTSSATDDPSGVATSATMSGSQSVSDSDDPTEDPTANTASSTPDTSDSDSDTETGDAPRCGDGTKDRGEECDLGDEGNFDEGACQPDCTKNECGDGKIGPRQPCDDGPQGSETCTSDCQLRSCGDGMVQKPEECDDDNDNDNDICTNACTHAECGDGIIHEGVEQCETNNLPTCASVELQGMAIACDQVTCTIIGCTDCGNGVLEPNEYCEPGDILTCEQIGFAGEADIDCGKDCQPVSADGCCVPAGDPCLMGIPCCGSCQSELCEADG